MNKQRIEAAIELMKRARNLDMVEWQTGCRYSISESVEELHACGNAACFAGYLAISTEFREAGGYPSSIGQPVLPVGNGEVCGEDAVAEYLGISNLLARKIVMGAAPLQPDSHFYGKPFEEVGPVDVIAKLELILAGELK